MSIIKELQKFADDNKTLFVGSLQTIATKYNLSRERVRQIAKANGFIMPRDKENKYLYSVCVYCGKRFKRDLRSRSRKFCSPKCSYEFTEQKYWTIIECQNCHKYFKKLRSLMKYRKATYCSKTCQGKALGREYGWGTKNSSRPSKYGDIEKIRKDLPKTFTVKEFANKYNYSSTNSAWTTLSFLVRRKQIERIPTTDNINLYCVKNKTRP